MPGGDGVSGETAAAPPFSLRHPAPMDILHAEEVQRARVFFRALAILLAVLLAFLLILPGEAWIRIFTAACCGTLMALSAWTLLVIRDERRYTPTLTVNVGVIGSALGVLVVYYLGLFSAAAAMLTVGIYFFGMSRYAKAAHGVYLTIAGCYLLGTVGIALRLVPDHSLFSVERLPEMSRWYRVLMMQVVFGLTFYLARSSRRATTEAIAGAQQMRTELKQRDAQLAEAKNELDWALRTGEGQMTGQTVGDYEIELLLGRGGMGEVYSALHLPTQQRVALKLLHPNMLENPEYVQRFMREAQAAAAVPSEHVAAVYELGFTPYGGPFIAMELLDGHDLAYYLRKAVDGRLSLEAIVTMVNHAAEALAAVRDAGVVHRDLKPANLFLVDSIPQKWKVLDFGLSKIQGGAALTREVAMGTPQYMPPEQAQGLPVDHRADLYALAAITYRALTGQPPFVGDDIGPLLLDVLYTQPQQPGSFVHVAVEIELVLAVALAKKPEDRFGSVEEFANAFSAAAYGELDAQTQAHGWSLVKQYPWGTTQRRR
ncbi:MAG: serine/threonine-protein kinase [Polyangiaceae bacterium]